MSTQETEAHSSPPAVPVRVGSDGTGGLPAGEGAATFDAALLERVRRRDPEALGRFFEFHFEAVYGLVFRLLGNRAMAEDAASEVFLKVHRAADRIDPMRDPTPWLMTIATNVCRDLWRSGAWRMSRRSDSIEDDPVVAGRLAGGEPEPEAALLAAERERLVQEALMTLPEAFRVAIVLHDWQGLSHAEVAAATGIEHAAARKRYSRALAALARRLEERLR